MCYRIIFLTVLFSLCISQQILAQVIEVKVGVNGLTCSACTKNVEMKIRKLRSVQDVNMDLELTEGQITFIPSSSPDLKMVAKAVRDAGFTVREMEAQIDFSGSLISGDSCLTLGGDVFFFTNSNAQNAKGMVRVTLLGEEYQEKRKMGTNVFIQKACGVPKRNSYLVNLKND